MRHTMVILAVAALSAGAAQATTTNLYGTVDVGLARTSLNGSKVVTLDSSRQSDSLIGFKGTEELGQGLSAGFTLEAGFDVDTGLQHATLFDHEVSVSLASGANSLKLGRLPSLGYTAAKRFDVFVGGNLGVARTLSNVAEYNDNTVGYAFSQGAFNAGAQHTLGEQVGGGLKRGATTAFQAGYAEGPLAVSLTYTHVNEGPRTALVAGAYDFGTVAATLMYQDARDSLFDKSLVVGLKAPVATNLVALVSIGQARMVGGDKIDLYRVGGQYVLSKRTNMYAAYGKAETEGMNGNQIAVGVNHRF